MTSMTNNLENLLIEHTLRNVSWTSPATVYGALYTSATSDATPGTEVAGGSYARQAITFGAASGGVCLNSGDVTFPSMPACTVTHVAIWSHISSTTGTYYLLHGALSSSVVVTAGVDLILALGDLSVTFA